MNKNIITLTTDFGNRGYYNAEVKGTILSKLPNATIIDITNEVNRYDIKEAAFIIKNAYKSFPKGTIHLLCINTEAGPSSSIITMEYDGQWFIGADNGILSLICNNKPDKLYQITCLPENDCQTFLSRDIFTKVAVAISKDGDLTNISTPIDNFNSTLLNFEPVIEDNELKGNVIYIDSYENAIVNITKNSFYKFIDNKPFKIFLQSKYTVIDRISNSYSDIQHDNIDIQESSLIALFGSHGYLEIAMYHSNAASLLGLKIDSQIRVVKVL